MLRYGLYLMLYYLGKITDNEGYQHLANDLNCSKYKHGDNQS